MCMSVFYKQIVIYLQPDKRSPYLGDSMLKKHLVGKLKKTILTIILCEKYNTEFASDLDFF